MRLGHLEIPLFSLHDNKEAWSQDGEFLAAQALAPLASLPLKHRKQLSLIAVGPGAATGVLAAATLRLGTVEASLHPDSQQICTKAFSDPDTFTLFEQVSSLPKGAKHHRALLAMGGTVPTSRDWDPLVSRLRHEGQLIVSGIPRKKQGDILEDLAAAGMSLRAAGQRGELAFLSGSLEGAPRLRA